MNITMKYKSSSKTGEEEEHILKVDEDSHKSEELKAFFDQKLYHQRTWRTKKAS